jgi:hypothetical protein
LLVDIGDVLTVFFHQSAIGNMVQWKRQVIAAAP